MKLWVAFSVGMKSVIGMPLIVIVHGLSLKRFLGTVTLQNPFEPSESATLKLICFRGWLKLKSVIVELLVTATG